LKLLCGKSSFVGFWLNNPPGASSNLWTGKRRVVQELGFLVVFNGRTFAQIRAAGDATTLGVSDGATAVSSARHEGFPARTIIFLDQEEGGRDSQSSALIFTLGQTPCDPQGLERACTVPASLFKEGSGATVITAEDIRQNARGRQLAYWVTNDSCPPSPGCELRSKSPNPAASGVSFADVWQFAQSPRSSQAAAPRTTATMETVTLLVAKLSDCAWT